MFRSSSIPLIFLNHHCPFIYLLIDYLLINCYFALNYQPLDIMGLDILGHLHTSSHFVTFVNCQIAVQFFPLVFDNFS